MGILELWWQHLTHLSLECAGLRIIINSLNKIKYRGCNGTVHLFVIFAPLDNIQIIVVKNRTPWYVLAIVKDTMYTTRLQEGTKLHIL